MCGHPDSVSVRASRPLSSYTTFANFVSLNLSCDFSETGMTLLWKVVRVIIT